MIVDDVVQIRREVLMRRFVEVVRQRCFPNGAPIPLDFLVPSEFLSEIGTDDEELADLFGWRWAQAQNEILACGARGDRIAAAECQLHAMAYAEIAERYRRRAGMTSGLGGNGAEGENA